MSTEQTISKDLALQAIGTIASLAARISKGKTLADTLTPSQMGTFQELSKIAIGSEMSAEDMAEMIEAKF